MTSTLSHGHRDRGEKGARLLELKGLESRDVRRSGLWGPHGVCLHKMLPSHVQCSLTTSKTSLHP